MTRIQRAVVFALSASPKRLRLQQIDREYETVPQTLDDIYLE